NFAAARCHARIAFLDWGPAGSGLIFPRTFRNRTGDAMQRAFFGNGAGFCLRAIAGHHIVDVRCDRRRHERAVFAALRVPSLAALSAKAWPMDAAPEAIHGISAAGDAAVSSLRAWRAARLGRGDLGELLFADHQHRVLDERRSGDHETIAAIWPPRRATVRALPGKIRRADRVPGIAYQEYYSGETRNRAPRSRCGMIS